MWKLDDWAAGNKKKKLNKKKLKKIKSLYINIDGNEKGERLDSSS